MPSTLRRYMSPFVVVTAMCAMGGAVASVPLGAGFPSAESLLHGHPEGVLLIALLTAVFTVVVVGLSLKTSVAGLAGFGILGGASVCILAVLAAFAAQWAQDDRGMLEPGGALALFVLVGIYAGIVGGFIGCLFALVFVLPTWMAARQIKRNAVDGDARTGLLCAVWLAAISAAAIPHAPAVDTWSVGVTLGVTALVVAVLVGALSVWRILDVRALQRSFFAVAPAH